MLKTTFIEDRAFKALNLEDYNNYNIPGVTPLSGKLPECDYDEQYILRMLVKSPFTDFHIPEELKWLRLLILIAENLQKEKGITQPYCYVTVRHGEVKSVNDDVWHVDGFSMAITLLPEQNYIWTDKYCTEFAAIGIDFPKDFNPLKHNIHSYIQHEMDKESNEKIIFQSELQNLYCFDPYVIHRRPNNIPVGTIRTFVRIDFSPIIIADDNNTQNPLLPVPKFNRDGVKDFRDKLVDYQN